MTTDRFLPDAELVGFLTETRAYCHDRIAGLGRFPMRPLGRDDAAARHHEERVARRFAASEDNLFALCIDPSRYRGHPERATDEALYRLFILNEPVAADAIEPALGRAWLVEAEARGLLEVGADGLRSRARLVPHQGALLLAEPYSRDPDLVYLSYDSLFMADLVRRELRRGDHPVAVDLGTGSGILACAAAQTLGCPAIGYDLNPRALAFAAANAAINQVEAHWQRRPFAEAEFPDAAFVVANPPFVFCPPAAGAALHSAGGHHGLDATLAILDRLESRLPEGGRCLMISQSPVFRGAAEPRLVELLRGRAGRLDLEIENLGSMSPFARYAEFYAELGVIEIRQLLVRARRGHGLVEHREESRFVAEYCFG